MKFVEWFAHKLLKAVKNQELIKTCVKWLLKDKEMIVNSVDVSKYY
jgi:hypothetical protein